MAQESTMGDLDKFLEGGQEPTGLTPSTKPQDDTEEVTFDLGAVDENAPDFEAVPAGTYIGVVNDLEYKPSKSGNLMLVWKLEITKGEHKGAKLFDYTVL